MIVGVIGAAGVISAANSRTSDVERIEGLEEVLQAKDGPALNYLLIGSDTRPGRVYRVNPRTGRPLGTHPRPLVFANAIHAVTYLDGSIWVATNNPVAFDHDEIVRTSR